jgi:hypothetical protein
MTFTSHVNVGTNGSQASAMASKPNWPKLFGLREMGVYYGLVLLIAVLAIVSSYLGRANYLSVLNLTNIVYQSSLIAMMAVAMTVVLISGNFDLSVASVAAFAAVLLIGNADALGFWPAAALALVAAMAIGLLNGAIVQFVGINAFIVTLGTMTAVRGLILIYTDGRSLSVTDPGVLETMKAVEGGRVEAGWLILVAGVALLAVGAAGLLRSRSQGRPIMPTVVPGLGIARRNKGEAGGPGRLTRAPWSPSHHLRQHHDQEKARAGRQGSRLLELVRLRLGHEVGDGEVEHASCSDREQEALDTFREAAQQEPAQHGGDKERGADGRRPHQDAALGLVLSLVKDELANAQGLTDVVDGDSEPHDQGRTWRQRGAHTNGDALDDFLGARPAREDHRSAAAGFETLVGAVHLGLLIRLRSGRLPSVHVEVEKVDETEAQDEADDHPGDVDHL